MKQKRFPLAAMICLIIGLCLIVLVFLSRAEDGAVAEFCRAALPWFAIGLFLAVAMSALGQRK